MMSVADDAAMHTHRLINTSPSVERLTLSTEELAGRWGALKMLKTDGAYMTKESHDNKKVETALPSLAVHLSN